MDSPTLEFGQGTWVNLPAPHPHLTSCAECPGQATSSVLWALRTEERAPPAELHTTPPCSTAPFRALGSVLILSLQHSTPYLCAGSLLLKRRECPLLSPLPPSLQHPDFNVGLSAKCQASPCLLSW